jgi:hypothetical protein
MMLVHASQLPILQSKGRQPRAADPNAIDTINEPVHEVAVHACTCLIHAFPLSYQINPQIAERPES